MIRGIQRGQDLVDPNAVSLQQPRVDLDMNLPLESAHHRGLRHAVDLLEATLEHLLRKFLERPQVLAARHA